jgi:hypothetical protein
VAKRITWRRPQRRYRSILVRVRELLPGNGDRRRLGAYGVIRALRRANSEYLDREAIRKTREDARAVIGAIAHLDETLRLSTLAPELRLRIGLGISEDDVHAANSPAIRLLRSLEEVRALCEEGELNQPPTDQTKIWCARIAFSLMHQFSDEKVTSGSPDSTYRVLTGLLYEVLTGEAERDLKRACDDHLRAMHAAGGK